MNLNLYKGYADDNWERTLAGVGIDKVWGTSTDICMMANMLQADIFLYVLRDRRRPELGGYWQR